MEYDRLEPLNPVIWHKDCCERNYRPVCMNFILNISEQHIVPSDWALVLYSWHIKRQAKIQRSPE